MRGVDVVTEIDASREPIDATATKIPDDKRVRADAKSAVHLAEIGVEIIEESTSPLDPCEVILVGNADARDQLSNACGLFPADFGVFEIDVMNNLGDGPECWVVKPRRHHENFECAPVAHMGELRIEHIEPQLSRLGNIALGRDEFECCRLVDETPYHPGAGGPIDMHTSACDPDPPAKIAEVVGTGVAWFRRDHVVFRKAILQPGKQPVERLSAIC